MAILKSRRGFAVWAVAMAGVASGAAFEGPPPLEGKVVTLAAALKAKGVPVQADPDPIAKQVVLLSDDGSVTPLISDDASRALFVDERLRDRRVQIQAKRFPGLPYVQVITFLIEHEGQFQSAGYECDVCVIRVRYPQVCPCCQGAMVLRMKPKAP